MLGPNIGSCSRLGRSHRRKKIEGFVRPRIIRSALLFASKGARVVVADIDADGARQTVEEIRSLRGEAELFQVDACCEESVKSLIDFVVATYGRLDFAHNHVGHGGPEGSIVDIS